MASRSVDVITSGPPSPDPYHPTAPAWALAEALAAHGGRVRVLHPATSDVGPAPAGTVAVPLPLEYRHPGTAFESADWARVAGRHLLPDTDLVVRDPSGLGRVGITKTGGTGVVLASFVRSVELTAFDGRHPAPAPHVRDRVDAWRDRRSIRRLEHEALAEADRLFVDSAEARDLLAREYEVPPSRLAFAVPVVAPLPPPPTRTAARESFTLPLDVPVVAALTNGDAPEAAGVDRVREAFRRIRPIFPGVRLVVAGATAPADPGLVAAPARDGPTIGRALAAADVAVFAPRIPASDPGVVLALRAGVASIVVPEVQLPADPAGAVRRVETDDPGDLASALAELVADPGLRRTLSDAGHRYAATFDPTALAERVLGLGAPPH